MKYILKNNLYAGIVFLFAIIAFIVIYVLKIHSNFIVKENVNILSSILKVLFLSSFLLILLIEYFKNNHNIKALFSVRNLLIFSMITLLVFSIFRKDIGIYATGFYALSVLIYFSVKRELYEINKIFYFIFLYALFEFIGTINTPQGFHFPEMSYTFYILPLTYSLFRLEKHTMLRILKIFFRVTLVYIYISLIYWFFNFKCYDVTLLDWITKKIGIDGLPVFNFVAKWGNYTHPSYISLILLSALISGFYLFYKKAKGAELSLIELATFILGCVALEFILESRIGILEVIAIIFLSLIYYVKMKTSYFKISLIVVFLSVVFLYFIGEKHFNGMMGDDVRKADYTLAVNYIKDHPMWGSGYHEQRQALLMQDEKMEEVTRPTYANPSSYTHNQFLGNMVQYGIPGLIILLVLLTSLFWYAFKSRSYLLQMFMLIYLIFMFIEEPFYVQEGITRFTIFLSFFVALSSAGKSRKSYNLRQWFSKG